MATDFSEYSKMPILVGGVNPWFDNKIIHLGLFIKNDYVVPITNSNSKIIENSINENEDYNANFIKKFMSITNLKMVVNFLEQGITQKKLFLMLLE